MHDLLKTTSVLALAMSFVAGATAQEPKAPEPFPDPQSLASEEAQEVPHELLMRAEQLPSYSEPNWVTGLVEAGKLPPVEERLPSTPVVVDTTSTPDGPGVYGGILRHVSGARPEGWNWMAGQHQGWGGLTMTSQKCLVRTGPMWQLTTDKVEPLPELATSWEWSEDGTQLTMNLLEGAKWSDGDPFDAEDIMFMWEDNIVDTKVPSRAQPGVFGDGATLEQIDDTTVRWTFPEAFPVPNLYKMAYINLCPGPSHLLKPHHPTYNADATYDDYLNALPANQLPWVSMGPWVAVEYKPDEIMVFRRNPYFWQVDDQGNQLPYLDEVQWKLSSWEDRTIQTVAGAADYTNMENPSIYLESLKRAQEDDFPNSIYWGPRSLHWRVDLNLSTTCGVTDDNVQAVRDLHRDHDFRRAITHAVDREALGQSLIRGPFAHPFAGGLHTETPFYQSDMVVYYPFDPEGAKTLLAKLGFEDTDGDGFVNWTDGSLAGQNLEVTLHHSLLRTTDVSLTDSIVTMMQDVGIRVIPRPLQQSTDVVRDTCEWDWILDRGDNEYHVPFANLDWQAPLTARVPQWHQGTAENPQELLPFEEELVEIVTNIRTEPDTEVRNELLREYNRVATDNIYNVGLITIPAALIINKRIKNVPPGTPVLAYQWSEDAVMRERFWVAEEEQLDELFPETLPGIN